MTLSITLPQHPVSHYVSEGVKLLDEKEDVPWFNRVSISNLDQAMPCDCVLGRLHRNYLEGLTFLNLRASTLHQRREDYIPAVDCSPLPYQYGFDIGPYTAYTEMEGLREEFVKLYADGSSYSNDWFHDYARTKLWNLLTDEWKRVIADKQEEYYRLNDVKMKGSIVLS